VSIRRENLDEICYWNLYQSCQKNLILNWTGYINHRLEYREQMYENVTSDNIGF